MMVLPLAPVTFAIRPTGLQPCMQVSRELTWRYEWLPHKRAPYFSSKQPQASCSLCISWGWCPAGKPDDEGKRRLQELH